MRYETTYEECLAVVWSVLMLRPYPEGSHFEIWTDHQAWRTILDLKESTGRLARWRLRLLEFDFEVVNRPDKYHHAADAMSRLPKEKAMTENQVEDDISTLTIRRDDKNTLQVVCEATKVEIPMPSKAGLLESQECDTYCSNIKKMVNIEPS